MDESSCCQLSYIIDSTMYVYAHQDQFASHQQRNELLGYPIQKCLSNGVVGDALHFAIASWIASTVWIYKITKFTMECHNI